MEAQRGAAARDWNCPPLLSRGPRIWYQIRSEFHDEARPEAGVLRDRQLTMNDSWWFGFDVVGIARAFDPHAAAYARPPGLNR
jgi:hypothetical protein